MDLIDLGVFPFSPFQRHAFTSGGLASRWKELYPALFDDDDWRLAETQRASGYHFFEWLGAVLIYNATGWHSLVEKYQFEFHERKAQILKGIDDRKLMAAIQHLKDNGRVQGPDLLVYSQDLKDWYFCEVKGASDHLGTMQKAIFEELGDVTGKADRLLRFMETE